MPTFAEQLTRYFLQSSDLAGTGEAVPHTSERNLVKHHIDGNNYFGALKVEIEGLLAIAHSDPLPPNDSDPFFYILGWWLGLVDAPDQWVAVPSVVSPWRLEAPALGGAFHLDDGSGAPAPLMIDVLEEMSDAGIDVRVMGWVSPMTLNYEAVAQLLQTHAFANSINTIKSVEEIRRRIGPGTATLMTLGHPLGSMHLKTIVCGTVNGMRAFVSGIDLQEARVAGNDHGGGMVWHDAGVEISGPAAEAIYFHYRALWNEQIDRAPDRYRLNNLDIVSSHFTTQAPSVSPPAITPPISERHIPPPNTPGHHHVQVLRTLPRMSMSFANPETVAADFIERFLVVGMGRAPWSFAPDGVFEFGSALRKAISGATRYIYIEDQAFGVIEVMEWINAQLKAVPDLKVILMWGRDPGDPPTPFPHQAISNILINGVSNFNDRVRVFAREGIVVHSKITIIDDLWTAIGSANFLRRSLYTDGELSVSVMEDSPTPFAKVLRKDLWGELCGLPEGPSRDPLLDLDSSLALIDPTWSAASPPASIALLGNIKRMLLPFEYATPPGPGQWAGTGPPTFSQFEYDVKDPDSR